MANFFIAPYIMILELLLYLLPLHSPRIFLTETWLMFHFLSISIVN